jgi:hypothetical protein
MRITAFEWVGVIGDGLVGEYAEDTRGIVTRVRRNPRMKVTSPMRCSEITYRTSRTARFDRERFRSQFVETAAFDGRCGADMAGGFISQIQIDDTFFLVVELFGCKVHKVVSEI